MNKQFNKYRFLFAGGGTGGHIYPAIAVAQKLKSLKPESEILFVGTKNKIESRVVPENGFEFKSIWIAGFSRKLTMKNILLPLKVIVSVIQSIFINAKFKPSVALGTGAYVSGPVVWASSLLGSKIVLLEQNSYPGITNRFLEKKADEIHISFRESEKYFREKSKLNLTGNPVRINLKLIDKIEARKKLKLDVDRKTLLVLGGSLGSASINRAVGNNIDEYLRKGIQIIWQCGSNYYQKYKSFSNGRIKVSAFIDDMSTAYSACDLAVCRAGATTIAEIASLGIPSVFVPSQNVAANHQYLNAKAICDNDAAVLIEDYKVDDELLRVVLMTINDEKMLESYSSRIKEFSHSDAVNIIADNVIKLAEAIN